MADNDRPSATRMMSPPVRRYRRPAQSCEPCRRRKVRCDLEMPCSACRLSRAPVACTYRDDGRSSPKTNGNGNDNGGDSISENEHNIIHTATARSRVYTTDADTPTISSKRPRLAAESDERLNEMEQRLKKLEQSLMSVQSQASERQNSNVAVHDLSDRLRDAEQRLSELSPSGQASRSDNSIPSTLPRLRNTADKVKLFPSSHWLHTAEKVRTSAPPYLN